MHASHEIVLFGRPSFFSSPYTDAGLSIKLQLTTVGVVPQNILGYISRAGVKVHRRIELVNTNVEQRTGTVGSRTSRTKNSLQQFESMESMMRAQRYDHLDSNSKSTIINNHWCRLHTSHYWRTGDELADFDLAEGLTFRVSITIYGSFLLRTSTIVPQYLSTE